MAEHKNEAKNTAAVKQPVIPPPPPRPDPKLTPASVRGNFPVERESKSKN